QFYFRSKIRFSVIDDVAAVDVRRDPFTGVRIFGGRQKQPHSGPFRDFYRLQHSFAVGEAAEEKYVVVRTLPKEKIISIDAVEHDVENVQAAPQPRQFLRD